MSCGAEFFYYETALQPAAYFLYFAGVFGIPACTAYGIIKYADEIAYIVTDIISIGCAPVVHVDDLYMEGKTLPLDDDIVVVQITVVFAGPVYRFDTGSKRMQEVKSFEYREPLAGLMFQEGAEEFALDIFRHEKEYRGATIGYAFLCMILDENWTVAQLVQFSGVEFRSSFCDIPLREEKFGGAFYLAFPFAYPVHFSFPPAAEERNHFIFPGKNPARLEAERLNMLYLFHDSRLGHFYYTRSFRNVKAGYSWS